MNCIVPLYYDYTVVSRKKVDFSIQNTVEYSGIQWNTVKYSGIQWNTENSGIQWNLENSGIQWYPENSGIL